MPPTLLLFDIDGTLLDTGRAGRSAFAAAATRLFGDHFTFDGISFGGRLDPLIFAEAAARHRLDDHARHHDAFRNAYLAELRTLLQERRDRVRVLPGVHELLADLRPRRDVTLGVLTGNYDESAAMKLRAADIDPDWFRVSVFGDDAPTRPGLVALAMRRHGNAHGLPCDPRRVVVIGDTPHDAHCAKVHGCAALAVTTGGYGRDELLAAGADAVVDTLEDRRPLDALIGR